MNGGNALISGLAIALLVAIAAVFIVLKPGGGDGAVMVKAEFTDVNPLLEGNYVRVFGAIAGRVDQIELTDRETVMVTMELNEGIEPPKRDATASVRAEDLLGENYLSLSMGAASKPLNGPIPLEHTSIKPRLHQLLNVYDGPTRTGLQALLVELGTTFERRGADLNRSIVELRPALMATGELTREAASQNAALRRLIPDVERATSQLARRDGELDSLLVDLADATRATASRTPELDRGLDTLPQTLTQARGTVARLERFASEATPLAADLRDVAPGLATAGARLTPFLRQTEPAVEDLRPTIRLAQRFLTASDPTLDRLTTGLRALREAAPETDDLLTGLLRPQDSVGPVSDVDVPQVNPSGPPLPGAKLVENVSAIQRLTDSFFDKELMVFNTYAESPPFRPERKLVDGYAVFGCESFGVPRSPGCLGNVVSNMRGLHADVEAGRREPLGPSALALAGARLKDRGDVATAPQRSDGPVAPAATDAPETPDARSGGERRGTSSRDGAANRTEALREELTRRGATERGAPRVEEPGAAPEPLLDFLLGP